MAAVAYRRWLFTKGSNCNAFTGKVLVFWIGGRLRVTFAGVPRERFFLLYNEVAGKNTGPRQGDFERA